MSFCVLPIGRYHSSPNTHLQCTKRPPTCQIVISEKNEISQNESKNRGGKQAKLRLNFADIATPISPILVTNFAHFDPKFLQSAPKNRQIVDNFSSPFGLNFRNEATVGELILAYFCVIYLFLKDLCILSIALFFALKNGESPKNFQKTASKNPSLLITC